MIHEENNENLFWASFHYMQERAHNTAEEKGWWDEPTPTPPHVIANIASELFEAMRALRDNEDDRHLAGYKAHTVELADAVIRIMDYAGACGLPLADAIIDKMRYNETRPYRHGGKKF